MQQNARVNRADVQRLEMVHDRLPDRSIWVRPAGVEARRKRGWKLKPAGGSQAAPPPPDESTSSRGAARSNTTSSKS